MGATPTGYSKWLKKSKPPLTGKDQTAYRQGPLPEKKLSRSISKFSKEWKIRASDELHTRVIERSIVERFLDTIIAELPS